VSALSQHGAVASVDDERLARLLVAIRRRSGLRQADLAIRARTPHRSVVDVEAGRAGSVDLDRLRRLFEAAGGGARLAVWWNGAAADRLLDEQHAAIVERAVLVFQRRRWRTEIEASFSEFGERGSIDVLAAHATSKAIAVAEIKSELGSLEETNRVLDAKVRLAPKLALERFGWQPVMVGRLLILPERDSLRRVIALHDATMSAIYPARGREVRAWLRQPTRPLSGIWFISNVPNTHPVAGRQA
jgi:transcriptional regulator with XRE-family HTH domain